jgi:3-oxoacyl-(acyl-carrier-protein) synthase
MSATRITGAGWADHEAFGRVIGGQCVPHAPDCTLSAAARKQGIFAYPVKNFGRFDTTSKLTCCAVALALQDAGIAYAEGRRMPIGVIMTGNDGCLHANERYLRDYVESGRTLARGNLFIYTLPTSAAAEAAIHFGLAGPTLYIGSPSDGICAALDAAQRALDYDPTRAMLVVAATHEAALAIVVDTEDEIPQICSATNLPDAVRGIEEIPALAEKLAGLREQEDAT